MSNNWLTIDANGFFTMLFATFIGFLIKYVWDLIIRTKEKKDQKAESFDKVELENLIRSIMKEQTDILRSERQNFLLRLDKVENDVKLMSDEDLQFYRSELVKHCKRYIAREWMTTSEFDNLAELHRIYKSLGGNSEGDMYYHKAINVKIVNDNGEHAALVEKEDEKKEDDN